MENNYFNGSYRVLIFGVYLQRASGQAPGGTGASGNVQDKPLYGCSLGARSLTAAGQLPAAAGESERRRKRTVKLRRKANLAAAGLGRKLDEIGDFRIGAAVIGLFWIFLVKMIFLIV